MQLAARTEQLLGTQVEIKLPSRHASLFSPCFSEIARIEKSFSRFLSTSELSRLNSRLGAWQEASAELLQLVAAAEEFRQKTDGNFDITLKGRLEDLGYGPKGAPSSKRGISSILRSFAPPIKFDLQKSRILLNKEIEFGGLGKGYALDRVAALLDKEGVGHYYLNAGGDIFAKKGEGEEPWEILLEHPDDPERAIGKISLDGRAIAGSAPNRRKWGTAHHLLNAKTGKPASEAKAIFVLAKTGIEADAYATALFTAGFEEGIALSQRLPVEMLFISSKNKMYQGKGFTVEFFD